MRQHLNTAVNITILATLGVLLFSPSGPATSWIRGWQDARNARSLVKKLWPQLIAAPSALGSTTNDPRHVIEFIDYQCPSCASIADQLKENAQRTGARIIIRHYPLPGHVHAPMAARAAICGEEDQAFDDFHHALLAVDWSQVGNQVDWRKIAERAGIKELDRFELCLSSDATRQRLAQDQGFAQRLGVRGTPTFVTLGGLHFGAGQLSNIFGSR